MIILSHLQSARTTFNISLQACIKTDMIIERCERGQNVINLKESMYLTIPVPTVLIQDSQNLNTLQSSNHLNLNTQIYSNRQRRESHCCCRQSHRGSMVSCHKKQVGERSKQLIHLFPYHRLPFTPEISNP